MLLLVFSVDEFILIWIIKWFSKHKRYLRNIKSRCTLVKLSPILTKILKRLKISRNFCKILKKLGRSFQETRANILQKLWKDFRKISVTFWGMLEKILKTPWKICLGKKFKIMRNLWQIIKIFKLNFYSISMRLREISVKMFTKIYKNYL